MHLDGGSVSRGSRSDTETPEFAFRTLSLPEGIRGSSSVNGHPKLTTARIASARVEGIDADLSLTTNSSPGSFHSGGNLPMPPSMNGRHWRVGNPDNVGLGLASQRDYHLFSHDREGRGLKRPPATQRARAVAEHNVRSFLLVTVRERLRWHKRLTP